MAYTRIARVRQEIMTVGLEERCHLAKRVRTEALEA